MRSPTQAATSSVMSLTRPASTCCLSTPPPQVWNRSGGLPAWVAVVSLALNASFSSDGRLDRDVRDARPELLGPSAGTADLPGSVVAMFHHSKVTFCRRRPAAGAPSRRPRSARRTARSGPRAPGSFVGSGECSPWDLRRVAQCRFAPENFELSRIRDAINFERQSARSRPSHRLPDHGPPGLTTRSRRPELFESLRYLSLIMRLRKREVERRVDSGLIAEEAGVSRPRSPR